MTTIHQVHFGHVVLPDSHPRHNEQTCEIYSYVIDHPDGLIVVDTGPRTGHRFIDALYAPKVVSIIDAINAAGLDNRDVSAVVNTHLTSITAVRTTSSRRHRSGSLRRNTRSQPRVLHCARMSHHQPGQTATIKRWRVNRRRCPPTPHARSHPRTSVRRRRHRARTRAHHRPGLLHVRRIPVRQSSHHRHARSLLAAGRPRLPRPTPHPRPRLRPPQPRRSDYVAVREQAGLSPKTRHQAETAIEGG